MAEPFSPDAIAQKTFTQRLRGYHPDEVGAFLEEVAGMVRELQARSDALHGRLLELGNRDLSEEFDLISKDVGRILQDARETAEGMRKRAAADAENLVEEAQKASTALRSDAWMASDKLLQDSAKEAAAILQAAERDALVITSEAEREAHHRQNAVRRESEETVRAAKLEAERVLMDARSRADELILSAGRKVTAAEERAESLETRRTEMLEELESARQTISNLEGEIEKRREALAGPSPEEVESSTVKLLTGSKRETGKDEEKTVWSEGHEVVKIVRPPKRIVDPPLEPVDADAMAAEVARLRTPVAEAARPSPEPQAPEEQFPEPVPATPAEEPVSATPAEEPVSATPAEAPVSKTPAEEPISETLAEAPEVPAAIAPAAGVAEPVEISPEAEIPAVGIPVPPVNEIDDLFARLRRVEEVTPAVPAASLDAGDSLDADVPVEETSGPAVADRPASHPAGVADPFDLRDRLLLPVTNRVLRGVKRELTEAQNIALEELRLEDGNWEPAASTLSDRLVDVVGELLSESYTCGWTAAAELTETELVPGGPGPGDPADSAGWFAEALTGAVVEALAESHRDGRGPRQAAASLSRVYRSWRTDEAERRVRDMASRSYHRGLIDGFGAAGLAEALWLVAGRGCTVCRQAAEAGAVALGADFEDSVTEPPAHNDCGCTLLPA